MFGELHSPGDTHMYLYAHYTLSTTLPYMYSTVCNGMTEADEDIVFIITGMLATV